MDKQLKEIPTILYHATFKDFLKNIKTQGLGNNKTKAWQDSKPGVVYLARDNHTAESYAEEADNVPESWLDHIVVLKINTQGLNKELFFVDENNLQEDTIEYRGIIPPQYISIL